MAAALDLLLIGWLLQSALCGQFEVTVPETIQVLRGSCVTIPCSFDIENNYESNLDNTCKAIWKNDQDTVVFDSSAPQQNTIKGELTGDLTRKDCTTTLNNMQPEHSKKYFFRLECNNALKYSFLEQKLEIAIKDGPPRLTLTPSTLKVKEGTSVKVTCSAPAPCLSHPPTLTWTPSLGDIDETLQENQDKTKFKTSVLTFTASHLHHRQEISCTAVYNKQDGSTESSVTTRLTADILCALCGQFEVTVPETIEVLRGSCVTIPCSFDIENNYESNLDNTCKAIWKNDQDTVVFDSSAPQQNTIKGELTGDLTRKDCTTTLNNMQPEHSKKYFFRLECNNALKYSFLKQKLEIAIKDGPPRLTLTPSTLEVKEGTSVKVTCSAPAPCLSHPPTLTWTPSLGDIDETLQENQDKTKFKTSVLTFTASHLHHRQEISCTAVYNKEDGSTESSVSPIDISCALCEPFEVTVPETIEVLRGSCVTIPCCFDIENNYESNLDNTCKAIWKNDQDTVVFDSSAPQQNTIKGELTGDLKRKDCTTTLNNMQPEHSKKYFFRLECNNALKYSFLKQKLEIAIKDGPPRPTLTPSTLKVKEGTSVNVTCSAPAPCLSHPPTLTWTPSLGDIDETLQENQDKTKFKTSVLTFTASHLHHRQEISCTAVYNKQDGSTESSVTTRLTADISFAPQILPSSDCTKTKTASQFNCSCETSGNPSPTLQWYLDGLHVNHSDKIAVSNEFLNDTSLRSFITVSQPNLSTLLCCSSNSLGSATQRFYVYILQLQTSAEGQDPSYVYGL
ncbi:myelin-associated glycoprotein-like isoform X2 [Micropterus salmoides]|uniref:myelin-associated glycoprotein-like isoform X2 n=1 Tax=Micropterus salmoides TaxID=27706 RepID=UPI0018EE0350|nr:myelin-associated glycoprotein-like isoform X2 [Micropterus salmoides]